MPIRKFTNGRFSLKRFTAPGIGTAAGGGGAVVPTVGVQIFTETSTWTPPANTASVDYFFIAGGGGGGADVGGGGGAGGVLQGIGLAINSSQTYTVTIGAGGGADGNADGGGGWNRAQGLPY